MIKPFERQPKKKKQSKTSLTDKKSIFVEYKVSRKLDKFVL